MYISEPLTTEEYWMNSQLILISWLLTVNNYYYCWYPVLKCSLKTKKYVLKGIILVFSILVKKRGGDPECGIWWWILWSRNKEMLFEEPTPSMKSNLHLLNVVKKNLSFWLFLDTVARELRPWLFLSNISPISWCCANYCWLLGEGYHVESF